MDPSDNTNGTPPVRKSGLYVVNVTYKDGRADSPVFISEESPARDDLVKDAVEYFRQKYKDQGTVSVALAGDLGEAGVSNVGSIQDWRHYRDTVFHFDEKKPGDRLLKKLFDLGISVRVIEALQKDFDVEENEKSFLVLVDALPADMQEKELIKKALSISKKAHEGSTQRRPQDVEGAEFIPYVNHPIQVAQMALKNLKLSPAAIQAALLHDVIEDTSITFEDLEKDFSSEVLEILRDLTKRKDESREMYLKRVQGLRGVSKLIKCLDRFHNLLRAFTVPDGRYIMRYIKESREIYLPEFFENPALSELALFFHYLIEALEKYKEKLPS